MEPVVCITSLTVSPCELCQADAASICLTHCDLLCLWNLSWWRMKLNLILNYTCYCKRGAFPPTFLCLTASPSVCVVPSQYLGVSREQIRIMQLGQMSTDHGSNSCCRWTRGTSFFFSVSLLHFFNTSYALFRQLGTVITYVFEKPLPIWNWYSPWHCLSLLWNYLTVLQTLQNSISNSCTYSSTVCRLLCLLWSHSTTYRPYYHQKWPKKEVIVFE